MEARKRNRRSLDPAVRAELDLRYDETTKLLEARIAYHRAKIAEERRERERREAMPAWRRLLPF